MGWNEESRSRKAHQGLAQHGEEHRGPPAGLRWPHQVARIAQTAWGPVMQPQAAAAAICSQSASPVSPQGNLHSAHAWRESSLCRGHLCVPGINALSPASQGQSYVRAVIKPRPGKPTFGVEEALTVRKRQAQRGVSLPACGSLQLLGQIRQLHGRHFLHMPFHQRLHW